MTGLSLSRIMAVLHKEFTQLLREGYAADLVIFKEAEVSDIATFEKPHAYSKGFYHVVVNGALTVENEKHTGTRAGKALYGPGHRP